MSEQENRGGAAFEEEFSALEQAAPQGGGDMGDTMAFIPPAKHKEQPQPAWQPPEKHGGRREKRRGAPDKSGTRAPGDTAEAPPHKAGGGTRALGRLCIVLAISFAVLASASMVLSHLFNPGKFVAEATQALAQGDTQTLEQLVQPAEGLTVDEASLAALCDAFAQPDAREALAEQLAAQAMDETLAGSAYPALGVAKDNVFLGYAKYKLAVQPVQLMLTSSAQNPLLSLNGVPRTGRVVEGGVLYEGLFPGQYSCAVTASSGTGSTVTGQQTVLSLFSVQQPTEFSGALAMADITVSGCPGDETKIFIDGAEVAQKPQGGTVSLPMVAVGSTISMEYTAPHGAVTTGSVVFSDLANTALAFGDVKTEGGVPDAEAAKALLGAYYASYLDAVNKQDIAAVLGVTEAKREDLKGTLSTKENLANVFSFTSAECTEGSLTAVENADPPRFRCTAAFTFQHTNKESHEESSTVSYQACEFVFQDGAWVLDRTASIDKAAYEAGDTGALNTEA